jgi:Galactosyltransferase
LPVAVVPDKMSPTSSRSVKWLNQIFLTTCVACFFLQLYSAITTFANLQTGGISSFSATHFGGGVDDSSAAAAAEGIVIDSNSGETGGSSMLQRKLAIPDGLKEVSNVTSSGSASSLRAGSVVTTDIGRSTSLGAPPHSGRLRVLFGILTADFGNDQVYRKRHRDLFKLWNDPRVCSLPDFKSRSVEDRYECELIWTFVIGANQSATPELVDNSRPMVIPPPIKASGRDLNEPDVVLLNIRENMNEGKSQTWMKYGAELAEQYDLDYVVKCDTDAILHLHEFFHFAYKNLPPAPYNRGMYVGALRDKAYWPKHDTEAERIRFESYFGNNFEGVHLYVAGQIYIVSRDVAEFIGQEARESKCSYCEGHEDHDITSMAFHYKEPLKVTVIGRSHRFWEHPVKGSPRWRRIWARETARMAGKHFEDRLFTTNSRIEDVLGPNAIHVPY